MEFIIDSLKEAIKLIVKLDREFLEIVLLSLKISGVALIISIIVGLPFTFFLYYKDFFLKRVIIILINTFLGIPTVVVGLFLFLILSRSGPLGFLGLLYTPYAIIVAQFFLSLPYIISITFSSLEKLDKEILIAYKTLGANTLQIFLSLLKEVRYGVLTAICSGFGRIISEIGAVLIVGGNIAHYTRVMTTAIALEIDKGNFILALALGLILLAITFVVNLFLYFLHKNMKK